MPAGAGEERRHRASEGVSDVLSFCFRLYLSDLHMASTSAASQTFRAPHHPDREPNGGASARNFVAPAWITVTQTQVLGRFFASRWAKDGARWAARRRASERVELGCDFGQTDPMKVFDLNMDI